RAQVDAEVKPSTEDPSSTAGDGDSTDEQPGDSQKVAPIDQPGGGAAKVPTRFHATKDLNSARVVRDVSQVADEIVTHFVAANANVRVTIDIESDQVDKLTEDQRVAIRENLRTLGFAEEDWSME